MSEKNDRVGIAGASSLAGKELADELHESALAAADVVLLDEGEIAGQLETIADEVTFVQKLEPAAFEGMDFVFFCDDADSTKKHWNDARRWGASIIDLTYALQGEPGSLVRAPWVQDEIGGPDLGTRAVVSAHPAAVILALVAHRLQTNLSLRSLSATVLQPASEHGRVAMDELHQQTVNLLSFQTLPRDEYDAQVAFNLLPSLGSEARVRMADTSQRIREHYETIGGGKLPELALVLLQAPVFHGYGISMLVELAEAASPEQVEGALACDQIDVVLDESDPPSNLSAAGQGDILAKVSIEPPGSMESKRFWIWMTADNLKIAAQNAIACAVELKKLRPQGSVQ